MSVPAAGQNQVGAFRLHHCPHHTSPTDLPLKPSHTLLQGMVTSLHVFLSLPQVCCIREERLSIPCTVTESSKA